MLEQISIISVLILFLIVGFWMKNRNFNTVNNFSINKGNLGWFSITAGISMTYAGGAALLTMPSLGYSYGWYALVDPIALFLGILIVIFFINKYKEDDGVTIADLFAQSDKKLSILIGVVSTFVFLLILAAQFVALFKLIAPYFPEIPSTILILVPAILVFSYVFLGGLYSVTKTDILQLIAIVLFFLIPVAYFGLVSNVDANISATIASQKMPINLMIMLSLSLVFIPVSQDINIRVKSAKNISKAVSGLLLGAFIYGVIIIASIYIGISLAENGVEIKDTEQAISVFFKTYYPQIGIFAILAVMTAIVSTLDSYSLNAITAFSKDILPHFKIFEKKLQKQLIQTSGMFIFILAISIALFFNQVLLLILTALLIYISILIPIAVGKKIGVNDHYIFISSLLLIGIIVFFEMTNYVIELKPIAYPTIGLGLMSISYVMNKRT